MKTLSFGTIFMRLFIFLLGVLLVLPAWGEESRIPIGRFSQGDLTGWQPKVFSGKTHYELRSIDHRRALYAKSHGTASGLYFKTHVDLHKTPYLNWSWQVENILPGHDERSKGGDDYPARLYVVFSGGLLFWRTLAINYVWSSNQPTGSQWPNAYTANARMIAVHAGKADLGRWVREKRNVLADYRRLFGADPGPVDAVALMTDTDNTHLKASAWYGDIWFSDH